MGTNYFRKMFVQLKKIFIDKWCEGERIKSDPGEKYVVKWVQENAKDFSDAWELCLCRNCLLAEECGDKLCRECDRYSEDREGN